jgi:nicotinate-nucleotide pyrophosphorylase
LDICAIMERVALNALQVVHGFATAREQLIRVIAG